MIKTLKTFGVLCAVESVVAFTFLIVAGMCLTVEAIDGVVVSLLVAGGALALGVSRYRTLTAAPVSSEALAEAVKPKRNRAKPAPAKPAPAKPAPAKPRKVTKRPKSKK